MTVSSALCGLNKLCALCRTSLSLVYHSQFKCTSTNVIFYICSMVPFIKLHHQWNQFSVIINRFGTIYESWLVCGDRTRNKFRFYSIVEVCVARTVEFSFAKLQLTLKFNWEELIKLRLRRCFYRPKFIKIIKVVNEKCESLDWRQTPLHVNYISKFTNVLN